MDLKNYKNTSFYLFISVLVIVIFRLILTAVIPLLDKTESRYGEIARIMHETKNWVVLQIDYGIPFWAKPPMSTWLSALSFETFGVSEMAVRFPSYLLALVLLLILGKLCAHAQLWGKAKDYFERCLALGPHPEASLAYGDLLKQLDKKAEALVQYQKGLSAVALDYN